MASKALGIFVSLHFGTLSLLAPFLEVELTKTLLYFCCISLINLVPTQEPAIP